jgi:hypothetical protein
VGGAGLAREVGGTGGGRAIGSRGREDDRGGGVQEIVLIAGGFRERGRSQDRRCFSGLG